MKNKKLRAHSMREIWALGATASEYRRVTREFPEDWVKEFQLPADPGATAESRWIQYLESKGRLQE